MSEYIEREALLKHAIALNNPHELGENIVPVSDIEAAPAADGAEVVHGEWAFTNAGWKCSLCGHSMPYWPMASTQEKTNYCPNCGAKMDKEDET